MKFLSILFFILFSPVLSVPLTTGTTMDGLKDMMKGIQIGISDIIPSSVKNSFTPTKMVGMFLKGAVNAVVAEEKSTPT